MIDVKLYIKKNSGLQKREKDGHYSYNEEFLHVGQLWQAS